MPIVTTTRTWVRRARFAPTVVVALCLTGVLGDNGGSDDSSVGAPAHDAITLTNSAKTWTDSSADTGFRPTGSLAAPHFSVQPDLLSLTIRGWLPTSQADPYTGAEVPAAGAHIFRLDLLVDGLVNPPGPLALGGAPWSPGEFGDDPLYGFIELDIDGQSNSGGELEPVARVRYLANVARFGGLPTGSIGAHAAQSAADYDGVFLTEPVFEESGAEFTLVLCGCFQPTLISQTGNGDGRLDTGETMIVRGRFFERMQAVAPFAGSFGGSDFGLYDPDVDLRFANDAQLDETTVSLVYALDQTGASILTGEPEQPMDLSLYNHTSLAEGLNDLILTSEGAFGPITDPAVFELIREWQNRPLADVLNVLDWDATALLGGSYINQGAGALYVWTDTGFNATFGDMDTDGFVTPADQVAIANTITSMDGGPTDADGFVNGSVQIVNFGPNFNLHDLDNNGFINAADINALPTTTGDLNGDGRVNGVDLALVLSEWGSTTSAADLNGDGVVDGADLAIILSNWTG